MSDKPEYPLHSVEVEVEGVRYPTMKLASQLSGISRNTILKRIRDGIPGFTRITPPRAVPYRRTKRKIRPMTDVQKSAHAKAMAERVLSDDAIERIAHANSGANSPRAIPVKAEGVLYDTISAACDGVGVCYNTLMKRVKDGREGYSIEGTPRVAISEDTRAKISRSKKGKHSGGTRGKAVTVNGVDYPSVSSAARARSVSTQTIRNILEREANK